MKLAMESLAKTLFILFSASLLFSACKKDTDLEAPNTADGTEIVIGDNDGLADDIDPNPNNSDSDGDGIPDGTDVDPDGDGTNDNGTDSDGDGINDDSDVDETGGIDSDGDGIDDDALDPTDKDNDGLEDVIDPDDNDPDTDDDGIEDGSDVDVDGDGVDDNGTDNDNDGVNDNSDDDNTEEPPVVSSDAVSYATIAAGAPQTSCLLTDNEYLAEFLRQNPDVAYWEQGGGTITAVAEPQNSDYTEIATINPSGGNDTQAILSALSDLPEGGVLDGGDQLFRVVGATLSGQNASGKTIRNMRVVPNSTGNTTVFTVTTPEVTFLNVHIDGQNSSILYGWSVRSDADSFSLVNSSIKDVVYTGTSTAAALRIYNGANDVYLVNNSFRNLIADNPAPATARMRAILISGDPVNGENSKGGITASNLFENLQSNGQGDDADAFVVQGFGDDQNTSNTFQPNDRHLFIANVGIDAGKRIMKAQSGGVDVHSNFNHWATAMGPLGRRVTRGHYIFHGGSYHRVTNNLAISDFSNPNSESFFVQIQTHRYPGDANESTDNVVNCNSYTHNASTDNGASSYGFMVYDISWNGSVVWPKNSEMNNNHVDGSGELRFHYWFRINSDGNAPNDPGDPMGLQFDHTNNTISVPFVQCRI